MQNKPEIEEYKIVRLILKAGRIFVRFDKPYRGKKQLPRAVYNWLKHNPSFFEVPKGYVIHHLDLDETNDDPSNLVLMHQYHHLAYHAKHKITKMRIEVDSQYEYAPINEPRITFHKIMQKYVLNFFELVNGYKRRKRVSQLMGKPFLTHKDAEKAKSMIWQPEDPW